MKEPEKLITLKIKLKPNWVQKQVLNRFIDTYRYVYNRTVEYIEKFGYDKDWQTLRDTLVSSQTKKTYSIYKYLDSEINRLIDIRNQTQDLNWKQELDRRIKAEKIELQEIIKSLPLKKNILVTDWECQSAHKDIRTCAVKSVCDAYKTSFKNLERGNIKFFRIGYKTKSNPKQTIELTPSIVSIKDGVITLCPTFFASRETCPYIIKSGKKRGQECGKKTCKAHGFRPVRNCDFRMSKRDTKKWRNLKVEHNTDLVKYKGEFYLHIVYKKPIVKNNHFSKYCAIDPGLRSLMTLYDGQDIKEYKHDRDLIKKLNLVIDKFKGYKRIRKKTFNKLEKRKTGYIDNLQWQLCNELTRDYDIIFFGDIKSHDIVKGGKNSSNNREFCDIGFYKFKEKLLYKAQMRGKKVFLVSEYLTTKGCSRCGSLNRNVGSSEVYNCVNTDCGFVDGRDINSARNILLKGVISYL